MGLRLRSFFVFFCIGAFMLTSCVTLKRVQFGLQRLSSRVTFKRLEKLSGQELDVAVCVVRHFIESRLHAEKPGVFFLANISREREGKIIDEYRQYVPRLRVANVSKAKYDRPGGIIDRETGEIGRVLAVYNVVLTGDIASARLLIVEGREGMVEYEYTLEKKGDTWTVVAMRMRYVT